MGVTSGDSHSRCNGWCSFNIYCVGLRCFWSFFFCKFWEERSSFLQATSVTSLHVLCDGQAGVKHTAAWAPPTVYISVKHHTADMPLSCWVWNSYTWPESPTVRCQGSTVLSELCQSWPNYLLLNGEPTRGKGAMERENQTWWDLNIGLSSKP